jgi:hypothetical protein
MRQKKMKTTLTTPQRIEQQETFKEMFLTQLEETNQVEYNKLLQMNKLSKLVIKTSQQMMQDLDQLMKEGMSLTQAREIVIHNYIVEM